ncbi:unnamed protein product [Urochloa humidicola]
MTASTAIPQCNASLDRMRFGEKRLQMIFGRHLLMLSFRGQKLGRIFLLVLHFSCDESFYMDYLCDLNNSFLRRTRKS